MTGDIPHLERIPENWKPEEHPSGDRITPYDRRKIEDRVDEIVLLDGQVHIEMMSGKSAWMRIGNEVFWIHAQKTGLVIRWHETYRLPPPPVQEKP